MITNIKKKKNRRSMTIPENPKRTAFRLYNPSSALREDYGTIEILYE